MSTREEVDGHVEPEEQAPVNQAPEEQAPANQAPANQAPANQAQGLADPAPLEDDLPPDLVEVRRNQGVAAVIGAASSAVAIAWFGRAIDTGGLTDWLLVLLTGVLGVVWLAAFLDARTPLLVADTHGVRVRLGRSWVGLPWTAVLTVRHVERRGALRDGLVEVVAHNPERMLSGVSPAGARQARIATRLHGGPLALPLGWGTTVVGSDHRRLGDDLAALAAADPAADVVVRTPAHPAPVDPAPVESAPVEPAQSRSRPGRRRAEPGSGGSDRSTAVADATVAAPVSDLSAPEEQISDVSAETPETAEAVEESLEPAQGQAQDRPQPWTVRVAAAREAWAARQAARAQERDARRVEEDPHGAAEQEALREAEAHAARARAAEVAALRASGGLPEPGDEATDVEPGAGAEAPAEVVPSPTPTPIRTVPLPARADLLRVTEEPAGEHDSARPGAGVQRLAEPGPAVSVVDPVVVEEHAAQPAVDPVIGPEVSAARARLGLSVEQVSERTRIRPHVIEAIEVDDFAPCGGDFYARGHLRTLARVLGLDPELLLRRFDERYAQAPIEARKVFEADLATGSHGAIRVTRGGPNWSVLVAAVMGVVLVWSVVQLVLDSPSEGDSTPVLNGSGGPTGGAVAGKDVRVVVTAPESGAEVVVRDAGGTIVYSGTLAIGEETSVEAAAPVRVQSSDGSVVVRIDGRDRGPVGEEGTPAQGTYAAD